MPGGSCHDYWHESASYMPLYEYRADDGRVVERLFRMTDDKPEVVREGGVEYRRVYGNCSVDDGAHRQYPYVSKRLAGTAAAKDCEHKVVSVGQRGHRAKLPVVQSPQHEREIMARHNLVRE